MTNEQVATDVVVRDGSTVCLRRADERDVAALRAFLSSLSEESLYYRFMGLPALDESRVRHTHLRFECRSDVDRRRSRWPDRRLCPVFTVEAAAANQAEVAFAVADAVQGHGIGTRLLEHLARLAQAPETRIHPLRRIRDGRQPPDARCVSRFRFRGHHHDGGPASITLRSSIWM